jgi:uncharacterized iron-regulated protein
VRRAFALALRALAGSGLLAGSGSLAGCAHSTPAPQGAVHAPAEPALVPPFVSPIGRDHPLVGKVWSAAAGGFVSAEALAGALAEAHTLLLGESHDNADHHALEASLLTRFLRRHPGAAVGFEMLDQAQRPGLSAPPPQNADELAARVRWSESGWPAFPLYAPVFSAALAEGAPILALHPDPPEVRQSLAGVPEAEARALHLDAPLSEAARAVLADEIRESHCGHASPAMVDAMSRAQSFKDAYMARARLEHGGPAAVVAGRGHVRRDRGIPLFLARANAQGRVLVIAMVDVRAALSAPAEYGVDQYDFTVFTPAPSDDDPCQRFREQLEKLHQREPG